MPKAKEESARVVLDYVSPKSRRKGFFLLRGLAEGEENKPDALVTVSPAAAGAAPPLASLSITVRVTRRWRYGVPPLWRARLIFAFRTTTNSWTLGTVYSSTIPSTEAIRDGVPFRAGLVIATAANALQSGTERANREKREREQADRANRALKELLNNAPYRIEPLISDVEPSLPKSKDTRPVLSGSRWGSTGALSVSGVNIPDEGPATCEITLSLTVSFAEATALLWAFHRSGLAERATAPFIRAFSPYRSSNGGLY